MYRSGTTLLHHLFDAHPELAVFPAENPIIRDSVAFGVLPNSRERCLKSLIDLVVSGNREQALSFLLNHEKFNYFLRDNMMLSGSMGNQIINSPFNNEIFDAVFMDQTKPLEGESFENVTNRLFRVIQVAYFDAINFDWKSRSIMVNKCPEAGHLIDYYVQKFPKCSIIHIVRDPRAVIASLKADLPRELLQPFSKIIPQCRLLDHSLMKAKQYEKHKNVLIVRYEDLVQNLKPTMEHITKFLSISTNDTLLNPTVFGQPWRGNSSNPGGKPITTRVTSDINKFRRKINDEELVLIDTLCGSNMEEFGYEREKFCSAADINRHTCMYTLRSVADLRTWAFRANRFVKKLIKKANSCN